MKGATLSEHIRQRPKGPERFEQTFILLAKMIVNLIQSSAGYESLADGAVVGNYFPYYLMK